MATNGSLEDALEKLQHWEPDENTFKQNVKAWYEHRDQPPLGQGRLRAVVERKSKGQYGVSEVAPFPRRNSAAGSSEGREPEHSLAIQDACPKPFAGVGFFLNVRAEYMFRFYWVHQLLRVMDRDSAVHS
jgi:hypothetical protein